jgi:FkbM family methyltransferase
VRERGPHFAAVEQTLAKWWNTVRHWAFLDLIRTIERTSRDQRAMSYYLALPADKVVTFDYLGTQVRFFVPDGHSDNVQTTQMLDHMFFEQEELTWLAERIDLTGNAFIDVGANVGNHSVFWTSICRAARGWAFEPLPHNFEVMTRNFSLNSSPVESARFAITEAPQRLTLERTSIHNLGGSSFRANDRGTVEGRPLDSFEFSDVRLLKIDVEGAAVGVLKGGRNTIATHHPSIMIELSPVENEPCRQLLADFGYRQAHVFPYDTFLFERA